MNLLKTSCGMGLLALFTCLQINCRAAELASTVTQQLIASLDLTRPDLRPVRDAEKRHDLPAAAHAFAEHLRTRRNVHWRFEPEDPEEYNPLVEQAEANRAVDNTFTVVNYTYQFPKGAPIDWKFNPTGMPGSTVALNHEWTWQLNRMYFWPALAHSYRATAEPRYADALCDQLRSWIANNPVPEKVQNVPYSSWRTIEAGIRMMNSWPEVFFSMVSDRDAFPDDVLLAMVNSMREHAEYLAKFPSAGGNWKTMESNGMFHVGVLFPEFKSAAKWRELGIQRQHEELTRQVYPDGTQKELAPGYHNVALRQFLSTFDLATSNGVAMPADYRKLLERMFDVNMYLCMPDRTFPNFNDSGRGDAALMLRDGVRLFPQRQDWRWIATNGREGKRPAKSSYYLPQAGWAVMRSGWGGDDLALVMESGPFSTGHQHEDKLNFILDGYGSHLVAECGVFTYDASQMRRYCLGPYAHNLVFIDGLGQNRRAGPPSVMLADPKLPSDWKTSQHFDYAMGTFGYHEGERWGKDRVQGFIHTRQILFVKPSYYIVIDTMTPPAGDTAEHTYEGVFHLDAADAAVDAQTSAVSTSGADRASISILPLKTPDLSVEIVKGQSDPVMQGWISDHGYQLRPVPTAIFRRHAAGPVQMLYVFAAARKREPAAVREIVAGSTSGSGSISAEIQLESGRTDRIVLSGSGAIKFASAAGDIFAAKPVKRRGEAR